MGDVIRRFAFAVLLAIGLFWGFSGSAQAEGEVTVADNGTIKWSEDAALLITKGYNAPPDAVSSFTISSEHIQQIGGQEPIEVVCDSGCTGKIKSEAGSTSAEIKITTEKGLEEKTHAIKLKAFQPADSANALEATINIIVSKTGDKKAAGSSGSTGSGGSSGSGSSESKTTISTKPLPKLTPDFDKGFDGPDNKTAEEIAKIENYVEGRVKNLNKTGVSDIQGFFGKIIKAITGLIGSIALAMFVYGGFMVMIANGDPGKMKKGVEILVWSALGVVLILGSYAVVSFIFDVLV